MGSHTGNIDELNIRFWQQPAIGRQTVLLWDITSVCNLRCCHCYNFDRYTLSKRETPSDLSTHDALRIISDLKSVGINRVHFLGGEPLLRHDLPDLIKALKSMDLQVSINTNGTLFTDDWVQLIDKTEVDQIVFSLDAPNSHLNDIIRGTDSFNKCTRAIQRVIDNRRSHLMPSVAVAWTLTLPSLHDRAITRSMVSLCTELGVDTLLVNMLFECGAAIQHKSMLSYSFADALPTLSDIALISNELVNLKINIDARPVVLQYLNIEYGANFAIDKDAAICKGSKRHLMLRADGSLYPCAPLDSTVGESFAASHLSPDNAPNLASTPIGLALQSAFFTKWRNCTRHDLLVGRFGTCQECSFGTQCEPCPLIYCHKPPEECIVVQPLLKTAVNLVIDRVPSFWGPVFPSNSASSSECKQYDQLFNIPLNQVGYDVVALIDGVRSIKEISSKIPQWSSENSVIILRDVVTFINTLRSKGIIRLDI